MLKNRARGNATCAWEVLVPDVREALRHALPIVIPAITVSALILRRELWPGLHGPRTPAVDVAGLLPCDSLLHRPCATWRAG